MAPQHNESMPARHPCLVLWQHSRGSQLPQDHLYKDPCSEAVRVSPGLVAPQHGCKGPSVSLLGIGVGHASKLLQAALQRLYTQRTARRSGGRFGEGLFAEHK